MIMEGKNVFYMKYCVKLFGNFIDPSIKRFKNIQFKILKLLTSPVLISLDMTLHACVMCWYLIIFMFIIRN